MIMPDRAPDTRQLEGAEPLPTISVITCTYNSARYLEQAIRSVLDQRYPKLDYWIIDGGSTDETMKIVKKYEDRVSWISEPDRGIADAMNKGIRLSRGEIVAHLHSDDVYLNDALWRVGRLFQQRADVNWIIGNYQEINDAGVLIRTVTLPPYRYALLKKWNMIGHPAAFVRRTVFGEVGWFPLHLRYGMDYDLWLRIGQRYEPLQLSDTLACFRVHAGGLTTKELFGSLMEGYAIRSRLEGRGVCARVEDGVRQAWRLLRYGLKVLCRQL
jgi:glycosyltransferase involved in cell wall biosynthesis